MTDSTNHLPVLVVEVVKALSPKANAIYLDATFGRGGYSRAILNAAPCRVIAIDRDPDAIAAAKQSQIDPTGERLVLIEGRFSAMKTLLADIGVEKVDGIAFDLGVSSPQIDEAERGFSFRHDAPLDMRMEKQGLDACEFINTADEEKIAAVLWEYGEERASRRIARAIIKARTNTAISTTTHLADIIRSVMPYRKPGQIDPATRSFQAIRIFINDEIGEISKALPMAIACLNPGGRVAVVSFHSLEDRIVKNLFLSLSGNAPKGSRHRPPVPTVAPCLTLTTRKPITPDAAEIEANSRARSAKLRIAERTHAPMISEAA